VLYNAAEQFPFLSGVKLDASGANPLRELGDRARSVDSVELRRGICFVLTELLTVLGNLTAEILTPELHAALSSVALPELVRGDENAPGDSIHRPDDQSEGQKS
jgi:hypothetical protein